MYICKYYSLNSPHPLLPPLCPQFVLSTSASHFWWNHCQQRKVSTRTSSTNAKVKARAEGGLHLQPDQDGKLWGISRLRLVALLLVIRAEGHPHAQITFLSSLRHLVHSHWPRTKMPLCLKYLKRETWLLPWLCPSGRFLQPLAKLPFCEADGSSCEMSLTK